MSLGGAVLHAGANLSVPEFAALVVAVAALALGARRFLRSRVDRDPP